MEIYIGKDGQVLGPYYPDEIRARLDADLFDGTEMAWHDGLEAWVNVKELLEGEDEPAPEAEEPSVETESAQESEPLDEETLEQVNKIRELISDDHRETAWQLIQSLNSPRIYEGLLEDCHVDEDGWVSAPEYLIRNHEFFIRLLGKLPEEKLTQLKQLNLDGFRNQLTDVKGLEKLTQLEWLDLSGNQLTNVTGLEKLDQLEYLDLSNNNLTDVTGLETLTQLETLYLRDNKLTELKGLEKLAKLKLLWPSGNQLTDVKGLEKLTQLKKLRLNHNQLTDVKGLEKLTKLEVLHLEHNKLTNVKGLEKLTQLRVLYLRLNPDLTKAQIDQLQKALPKCKISSNPTK